MSVWALALALFLVAVLIAGLPQWPYTRAAGLGWFPSAMALALLLVVLILALAGQI